MAHSADPVSENSSARGSSRLPRWKELVFAGLMTVMVFGLAEGALRWFDYPPPLYAPGIFWGIQPNLDNEPFLHKELGTYFRVSTNSHSLRYREIPVGRQPDAVRILALGDSTTLGWGVEQDETYPAQLERLLQAKHPEIKIEVLNGGIPGYTSFQGLHHFKHNAGAYEPDLVLFGYIVQDARKTQISDKEQALRSYLVETLKQSWFYRLHIIRLYRERFVWFRSRLADEANEKAKQDPTATTRVPLDDYRENILTFKKLCEAQDAQMILFGFPLEVIGYTRHHRTLLTEIAKEQGLPHFDPSNTIHDAAMHETLYFPKDKGHPNAKGCALIAQLVAEYLENEHLLDQPIATRLSKTE